MFRIGKTKENYDANKEMTISFLTLLFFHASYEIPKIFSF